MPNPDPRRSVSLPPADLALAAPSAAVSSLGGMVVARLPADMDAGGMNGLRDAFLDELIRQHTRHAAVDCSEVEVMDEADVAGLCRLLVTVALIGSKPIVAGLRPGVAAMLANLDQTLPGVRVVRDLDEAMAVVQREGRARLAKRDGKGPALAAHRPRAVQPPPKHPVKRKA